MYDHTIWIGEFDGSQFDEEDAVAFARVKLGPDCRIQSEDFPTTLH